MLTRIDRIQVAVPDAGAAAEGWMALLGAEPDGVDRVVCLGAGRRRYRLGDGWLELLEPDGAGPVADAVGALGGHLFAAGATTSDVGGLRARLDARGLRAPLEGEQLHLGQEHTGGHGLRLVVSPDAGPRPPVGALDSLYEVTNLVHDAPAMAAAYADLFGLDPGAFVPITSRPYGYRGTLTLFDPDGLDRLEVITPTDPANTMGRFFARRGECLYMCFAESASIASVAARAAERGAPVTPVDDEHGTHTLFVHPPALGGVMLGLSRPTHAWRWSGHPERVRPGG